MRLSRLLSSTAAFAAPFLFLSVSAESCTCGYTLNSSIPTTSNGTYALYTDLLETDFLHLYSIPTSIDDPPSQAVGWTPQAYNVSPSAARGPYGKSAEVGNVVLNPLNNTYTWGREQGMRGGDPGLQIWVRGQSNLSQLVNTNGVVQGEMIRGGEIDSIRRDVRYGSFRVGMKMADMEGTCAAFFWFRNNTQEIDLEYLSRQSSSQNSSAKINLVIQSPLSASLGYNAAPTSTFSLHPLPFLPDTDYHEYRFDWSPQSISFWVDGIWLAEFDQYNPDGAGTLILNHWSNGDPNWSGGPPAVDATITVSYVKAYFNSSSATRNEQWRDACDGQLGWTGRVCEIPGFPEQGISPLGQNGNSSGKTFFFMYQGHDAVVNQTSYPAATAAPGRSAATTRFLTGNQNAWSALLVAMMVAVVSNL